MSQPGTFKRYTLLMGWLSRKTFPTLHKLIKLLEDEGFNISGRTLQRDIEHLRNEFGIEILFDADRKGYYIDEKGMENAEGFIRLVQVSASSELLINTIQQAKEALKVISFESLGANSGIFWLKDLLQATINRNKTNITHFNFHTGKTKVFNLEPLLLKQYLNRWYIHGRLSNRDVYITLGLDRIQSIEILDEHFINNEKLDPRETFSSVIGVQYNVSQPQLVRIAVNYTQINYLRTLPLHSSQEEISDDGNQVIIQLFVIINIELRQRLLSLGTQIKVLEPPAFVKEFAEEIAAMNQLYQ